MALLSLLVEARDNHPIHLETEVVRLPVAEKQVVVVVADKLVVVAVDTLTAVVDKLVAVENLVVVAVGVVVAPVVVEEEVAVVVVEEEVAVVALASLVLPSRGRDFPPPFQHPPWGWQTQISCPRGMTVAPGSLFSAGVGAPQVCSLLHRPSCTWSRE